MEIIFFGAVFIEIIIDISLMLFISTFRNTAVQNGPQVEAIDKDTIFPEISANSTQRTDIKRFAYFSQDYIYLHPDYKNFIADLRYGILPHDNKSLWGIEINKNDPHKHVF